MTGLAIGAVGAGVAVWRIQSLAVTARSGLIGVIALLAAAGMD